MKIDVINVHLRGAIVKREPTTLIDQAYLEHLPRVGEMIVWQDQAFYVKQVQHDFDQQVVRVIAEKG